MESIDFEFKSLGLGEGTPQGMQQISRQAQGEVRLIAGAGEDVKSSPLGLEKGGIDTEHEEAKDDAGTTSARPFSTPARHPRG